MFPITNLNALPPDELDLSQCVRQAVQRRYFHELQTVRRTVEPTAVDPDRSEPRGEGAVDVLGDAVAHHHGGRAVNSELFQRVVEDGRVGLGYAEIGGDDDSLEVLAQAGGRELLALKTCSAVGDERHRMRLSQALQGVGDVGKHLVPRAPLGDEPLGQLFGELSIVNPLIGEREPPCLAPVSRRPLAKSTHVRVIALKAAPQPLPRADADSHAVAVSWRRVPQLSCSRAGIRCKRLRGSAVLGRELRAGQEGGFSYGLLDHQRLVEVEQEGTLHGLTVSARCARSAGSLRDDPHIDPLRPPEPSVADESIRLSAYDPSWPTRFEEERAALEGVIGDWVVGGIHHVGSTAVPGLEAKPIIDILAGVRSLEESRACFEPLAQLGYMYAPYLPDEMHWFCKPHPSHRTHHLHLVPVDSGRYRDELAFRDRLRANTQTAAEYLALKRDLARRFAHDREAYTDAKSDFVRRILDQR